ncbi:WD repeat-containing protein 73-like isoform X3 [Zootermopsis nevadensis]|uniref:WD repeat-containing protein 73-like isoform X3 n=1 Tax=Zootermopsis nevadensis TaxID=136037 RepID=UPI000B8E720A|nr:WD repeat-containing protein 73-like isoform X3 [Zootermopsis nevadensis]
MYNMFLKDSDDEDEDEWFYDSIKRYKQLRMFDFENIIQQIELSDPSTICVVGKHKSGKHEVLELSLPEKLTVAPSHEGLVKNSDLKLKSGGFTVAPVVQMKVLWNQRRIIVSEKDQTGVAIYNLGSANSATTQRDFVVIDLAVNAILYKLSIDSTNETECGLEPSFVSENLAALCDRNSGSIFLHDVRASKTCGNFSPATQNFNESRVGRKLWTVKTTYCNKKSLSSAHGGVNNPKLGIASTMGDLVIYDLRNTSVAVCESNIGKVIDIQSHTGDFYSQVPVINFSPDDETQVSSSGFDGNVYVYNVSCTEKFKTVFVHDGHIKQSDGVNCRVTSHMWYQENIVISAADNSWLHCWQFIPDALS